MVVCVCRVMSWTDPEQQVEIWHGPVLSAHHVSNNWATVESGTPTNNAVVVTMARRSLVEAVCIRNAQELVCPGEGR